ncbi:hypothetical protein ACFVZH_34110 [Streptomyces sp. NPDC059534]|uniref:hypothetical protein n=1 Tax=Streptomyces sp. NPDC059534 TaxID=3346859 RepID=UPI003688872B
MRSALARIGAAVAVAALLTSCSGGDGGEAAPESDHLSAAEVCGGFAKDPATAAALEGAMGAKRFSDNLSEPEEALAALRDATRAPLADSYRPQPVKYCWLLPKDTEGDSLVIGVNAIRRAPGMHPELLPKVTMYTSGLLAYSSSGLGKVYFSCRLKAPAHQMVVETTIQGPGGFPQEDMEQRTRLVTLANATARQISAELGCQDDGLAKGVPAEAKG